MGLSAHVHLRRCHHDWTGLLACPILIDDVRRDDLAPVEPLLQLLRIEVLLLHAQRDLDGLDTPAALGSRHRATFDRVGWFTSVKRLKSRLLASSASLLSAGLLGTRCEVISVHSGLGFALLQALLGDPPGTLWRNICFRLFKFCARCAQGGTHLHPIPG